MSALGSLVVKLALEHAQFTGGLDKSEQAALAAAKRVQDTFDSMKSRLATTAGAIAGGLAAGFTISAFKGLIQGAIESNAKLDDLRMMTGASVAALREFAAIGKFNDFGVEEIAAGMNKLAVNISNAGEEGSKTEKALQAIGINFDAFKKLSPDERLRAVGVAMNNFADGSGKSAVAIALLGKEGAKAIPFLNDLGAAESERVKLTEEQQEASKRLAAQSANLDDNIKRLTKGGDAWKKELANGMIPALDQSVAVLLDMTNGTGGLRDQMKKLVADGSIERWTKTAITGLSYVVDAGEYAIRVLKSIGLSAGGMVAAIVQAINGNWRGALEALKATGEDVKDTFTTPTLGEKFRASLDKLGSSAQDLGEKLEKPSVDANGLGDATDKAAKAANAAAKAAEQQGKAYADLISAIQGKIDANKLEVQGGEKLTQAQQAQLEIDKQVRDGKITLTAATSAKTKAALQELEASEQAKDAAKAEAEAYAAASKARQQAAADAEKLAQTAIEGNQTLRDEIELIGLNSAQQTRVLQQRNQAIILIKEATLAELQRQSAITGTMTREEAALQAEIEALKERNALLGVKVDRTAIAESAQAAAEEWKKTSDQINQSLTDALMRGFESGKDFAKNMRDTIVNMFKTMVLRPVISAVVNPIAGAVTGAIGLSGAAQAAQGASTIGGIASGASMLGSLGGSLGAGFSMGMGGLSSMGAALEGGFAMLGSATGMSSALAGIGQIAGALGPVALGVGAIASLAKSFDNSGTIHTGGLSSYSAATGLQTSTTHGAFGMGFGGVDYSQQVTAMTSGLAQSIVTALDGTAKSFGKTVGYEAATAFADDTSKDGAWGGLRIALQGMDIVNWDGGRTSRWAPKEFADGEQGSKEYLSAVAKDVRGALEQIGLPSWATDMLGKLGDAPSIEQLAATVDQITATQAAIVNIGKAFSNLGFDSISGSLVTALAKASGGLQALDANAGTFYENFYSEAEKTANVTKQVSEALAAVGLQMPTTREGFRALLESQMALGDGGAQAVAALLSVSGAFASVVPAAESANTALKDTVDAVESVEQAYTRLKAVTRTAEDVAKERISLEERLFNATATTTQIADNARNAIDPLNQALYDSVLAAENAKTAQEDYNAALKATEQERKSLTNQLLQQQGNTGALRNIELAGIDESNRALQQQIWAIEDASAAVDAALATVERSISAEKERIQKDAGAQTAAIRKSIEDSQIPLDAAQKSVNSLKGIFDDVASAVKKLRGDIDPERNMLSASAYIDMSLSLARAGTMPDAQKLQEAIATVTSDTAGSYDSLAEFQYAQKVQAGKLDELGQIAGKQKTVAEQQLESLKDANKIAEDQIKAIEQAANDQITALDLQLKAAQDQVSALRGIDTSVQSVAGAIAALSSAIGSMSAYRPQSTPATQALQKPPTTTGPEQWVTNAYGVTTWQSSGGATAITDKDYGYVINATDGSRYTASEAVDYVNAKLANNDPTAVYVRANELGISANSLDAIMGWAPGTSNAWAEENKLPKFASGGYYPGGLALVGEQGPELINFARPGQVYTAPQTRDLLSSGNDRMEQAFTAMAQQIASLQAEVRELRRSTDKGNQNTEVVARAFQGQQAAPLLMEMA